MVKSIKNKIYTLSQGYGKKIGIDLTYFIKNGFWMMIRQVVDIVSGLAPLIVFSRLVSKDIFGDYQYFLALLSTISIVSLPGLNVSVFRSISRGFDGDYKKSVKISFFWSLLGIPTLLILGGHYYLIGRTALGLSLMIASVFFPLIYAPNTWNAFLQGKGRYDVLVGFFSVQSITNALATIGVIFFVRNNLLPIIISYLISYTFFNCFYYWKSLKYIENDAQSDEGIKYGHFLTLMNVFQIIAENIDNVILGALLAPSSVAIFGIVSLIPIKARGVLKSLFTMTFPKMTRDNFTLHKLWRDNKKIILLFIGLNLLLGLIYFFIIEKVSLIFFGNNYAEFYKYAKVFTVFISISLPLSLLSWYTLAKKMTKAIVITNPIYLLLKFIITVILIYNFGVLGCVWAYNLSSVMLLGMFLVIVISNKDM